MLLKTPFQSLSLGILLYAVLSYSCENKEAQSRETVVGEGKTDTEVSGGGIISPNASDQYWIFPETKDTLGSGGKLEVYIDHESHPHASSSFAKYELGINGALPEHKHDKTEEIAYFLSGQGVVITYEKDERIETPVKEGYVWYTAPGEWHSFRNTGNEPLKLVFAVIPNEKKGLLSFFKKVGAKPGTEARVFSPEEFGKLATEHDMILKPPTTVEE